MGLSPVPTTAVKVGKREDWSLVIVFAVNCPLENNRYSVEKAIKISRKRSVIIDVQDISNEE